SRRRERTKGAPSAGPPAPQSSYSCGSTPRSRSILCAFRPLAFPPLLLLPCGGALAGNGLHPGNVLAQAADLLQTLRLAHVQLELQLEQFVIHFAFLITKFFICPVSDFICVHSHPALSLQPSRAPRSS